VLIVVIAGIASRDVSQHLLAPDRARIRLAFKRVIRMGVVLASTGFVSTGAQLGARVLIARFTTLDDVGYFQAAWAVSVLYLGFVLGAMSLDYYPRLAEVGNDRAALTGMVNEQARVSFLLAGPAILGVLAFSSQVIAILYTSKFTPSVEILRWQLLGDVLKIGSWTLSYLVLAQGKPRVYFFTELTWNVAYLIALLVFLPVVGVVAAGIAYVVASGAYFAILCFVASRLAGFSWNRRNVGMMVLIAVLSGVSFAAQLVLGRWPALAIGGVLTAAFGGYCLWQLVHEAGLSRVLRRPRKK
jgi:PST family polysaccharide transporter